MYKTFEDTPKKEDKKELILLLFILIILILVFSISSYKVYAFITSSKKPEETFQTDDKTILKEEDLEDSNVLIIQSNEDDNTNEENNVEEIPLDNNTSTSNNNTTSNVPVHTAPNGEKYSKIAVINIPSLGIKYDILSSTSTALMKISVTKYWGPEPNEAGNFCIIGHNYRNTKFFSKLKNIQMGEIVQITDLSGRTLEYKVYDMYHVDPKDNSCTSQLNDGHTDITLITCTDDSKQRFIVKARAY